MLEKEIVECPDGAVVVLESSLDRLTLESSDDLSLGFSFGLYDLFVFLFDFLPESAVQFFVSFLAFLFAL